MTDFKANYFIYGRPPAQAHLKSPPKLVRYGAYRTKIISKTYRTRNSNAVGKVNFCSL